MSTPLAILGFGTMGQAITSGLVEAGGYPPERIVVADKGKALKTKAQAVGVAWAATAADAARQAETVLLAVKPKDLESLLTTLRSQGDRKSVV